MQNLLSIDLDYFVTPRCLFPLSGTRPDDSQYQIRATNEIEEFLKTKCLLCSERPTAGIIAEDHDKAFDAIKKWIENGELKAPFRLVHLDAHADLGMGDSGYIEIVSEILHRDISSRSSDLESLCPGNWLAYAIANRWIGEVVFLRDKYCSRDEYDDLLPCYFCSSNDWSILQMRPLNEEQLWKIREDRHICSEVESEEPEVNWIQIQEPNFKLHQNPERVFVCRSPRYSPPKADDLFNFIGSFVSEQ
ncbi:peptide arginase family protein [Bremerella sp. T1]|uniref:UPF0489 family protein n=1 Tax=Bremerella sp. TYQ1 TaxID=3119568 RepID=UPI001CCBE876|nr:UPF0489 family protein [Bremerella volcania]UBM34384.1 UPF0489 family protein [Bremerella volcania]